jgi:hypothetical protein
MAIEFYVNTSENDIKRETNPGDFTKMDRGADVLIFSAGSDIVADGISLSLVTPQALNSAGILITTSNVEVPHFFLADVGLNGLLKEIHNAGNKNKRYVFCFAFDAATASEPILELWDDDDLDSIDSYCLGEGIANKSFYRGITTTSGALPGDPWEGKRLAGSSDNHFLWLNTGDGNGALSGAKDLYCNIRITVELNFAHAAIENPVWVVKWTTN